MKKWWRFGFALETAFGLAGLLFWFAAPGDVNHTAASLVVIVGLCVGFPIWTAMGWVVVGTTGLSFVPVAVAGWAWYGGLVVLAVWPERSVRSAR